MIRMMLLMENEIVIWSSSDFGIASVDETGVATGIAEGDAINYCNCGHGNW